MDKMLFGPHVPWIEGKNGSWDNSDLGYKEISESNKKRKLQ